MERLLFCVVVVLLLELHYTIVSTGYKIHEIDPKYGISIEELDSPIFYNTYVPIIYEFKLPKWKGSDLRVKWPAGNSNQCDSSDAWNWSWDRQACPVVHHYNNLIDSLVKNMSEIWKGNTFEEKSNLKRDWPLNEIVPHFSGKKLSEKELDAYVREFGKWSFRKAIVMKGVSSYKDVNVDPYEIMLANFRKKCMTSIASEGSLNVNSPLLYTQYAVLTNSYTAIQAMQIMSFYMARDRWVDAFSTCKGYKIPQSIVTKDMLLKSLGLIPKQLSENEKLRFEMSISTDELSQYYNLELADCVFTTMDSFVVRILVPIRKNSSEEFLMKVIAIPFIKTEGARTEICELLNVEGEFISRDDKMNMIQENHCKSSDLCKVPDRSEWLIADPCFTAIIIRNETDIESFCQLHCQTYVESNGPYFKQIASNKYAIAGSSSSVQKNTFVLLSCARNPHKVIQGNDNGTAIVTLPCDCVLIYEYDTLTINGQCNETFQFNEDSVETHVSPYLWLSKITSDTNIKDATLDDADTFSVAEISTTSTTEKSTENGELRFYEEEETEIEPFKPTNSKVTSEGSKNDEWKMIFYHTVIIVFLSGIVILFLAHLLINTYRKCKPEKNPDIEAGQVNDQRNISDVPNENCDIPQNTLQLISSYASRNVAALSEMW